MDGVRWGIDRDEELVRHVGTVASSESGQPHHHDHHEEVLLHNERPKQSAPNVDAGADQSGVTERAPEIASD